VATISAGVAGALPCARDTGPGRNASNPTVANRKALIALASSFIVNLREAGFGRPLSMRTVVTIAAANCLKVIGGHGAQ
jgi:hypothetical protein